MEFPKYNWLQYTAAGERANAVYSYMSNATLGGGPLDMYFTVGTQQIASPLFGIWEGATAELMDRYEQGEMWAGGFFILMNLQTEPGVNNFVDVALYGYGEGMTAANYDALLQYNWTATGSSAQAPVCCFEDQEDGTPGIRHLLHGMARVIHYQVANASTTATSAGPNMTVAHVISYYEGEGQDGAPQGFGRHIRDLRPDMDVQDNFIGYQDGLGIAGGRYVYFNNFELVHQGHGVGMDYTEPPQDSWQFDSFYEEG